MNAKVFDTVLLKDGRTAVVLEIFDNKNCLFEICLPNNQYNQEFGTFDQIQKLTA